MILNTCNFTTERLLVGEWHSLPQNNKTTQELAKFVCLLLTPSVTRSLPEDWRGDYTIDRATGWIEDRDRESTTLLALERSSRTPVGLMILSESTDCEKRRTVRLGYVLSELVWGKGLASEFVRGFVDWCRMNDVVSIVGGVERDNIASRRVLEKNGFVRQHFNADNAELFYELSI